MHQLKKIFLSATIAVVAVGTVLPFGATAATVEELQAQINQLLAQLQQLQSQLQQAQGGAGAGAPAVCSGVTFTRNLTVGSSGADVKCLQALLNQSPDTQVAASGPGSPGNETTFFGAKTKAAVAKFQEKYASEVLTPVGLSKGTGLVGPKTREKLTAMLGAGAGAPPPPVTTGQFTVSLASDTPVSQPIVQGQATAPLAKFVFNNGTSSEVKVTRLVMKRIGVSNDSTLSNVYLFEGATRLTDAASVSESKITISVGAGIFSVGANSSKTITVVADIAGSTAGQTVGVSIESASDVSSTAASVGGTFPLRGNLMTVATANLATVDFSATTTPSAASTDPVNDYPMWQNTVSVGTRAVDLQRLALRQIGSVRNTDLQNFRLYVDGVQVGSAVQNLDSNGYVTFDLTASPKRLETGSRTIQMRGDIVGGSNLNFKFSLRNVADATFTDSQFGVNILPTAAGGGTFSARETGVQTINTGTVTLSKRADSPAGDVVKDANSVVLARYDVRAAGEPVKIESLVVQVDSSNNSVTKLRNGALFVDGVQVGSTADLAEKDASTSTTTYNLGSAFIAQPGRTYLLEVKADIFDSDGTNNISSGDTLQVIVKAGSSNAFAQTSNTTLNVPSADKSANTVTVRIGSLTLAKYTGFANPTYVLPVTNQKLNHFVITAASTEAVNLTDITFDYLTSSASNATNIYAKLGDTTLPTKATISATGNSWSVNKTINPGQSLDLIFYGDVSSSETAPNATFHVNVTGTTVGSATTVYGATGGTANSREEGQTVTWASSGTFEASKDGSSPLDTLVADNQTVTGAAFKFSAKDDSFTIKEIKLRVGANDSNAIRNAILKDGTTVIQTKPFDVTDQNPLDTVVFSALSVPVAANTSKVLTVDLELADVTGTNQSASGTSIQLTMTSLKYAASNGAETTDTTPGPGNTNPAGNTLYVFAGYPVFSVGTRTSTAATNGTDQLAAWKVKSVGGNIALKQLKFSVSFNDPGSNSTLKIDQFTLKRDGISITSRVTITDEFGNNIEGTSAALSETSSPAVLITWDAGLEEEITSTETTFLLEGVTSGFSSDSNGRDSVTFTLTNAADTSSVARKYLAKTNTGDKDYDLANTPNQSSGTDVDLVWSDMSVTLHNAAHDATGTQDWHNGYLVQTLPQSYTTTAP